MFKVKYLSAPAVYRDLFKEKIAYMITIQGNMRTSMYLKLIGIIYGSLLVAKGSPYGIMSFNMSHWIVFPLKNGLRKHVHSDESILNEI